MIRTEEGASFHEREVLAFFVTATKQLQGSALFPAVALAPDAVAADALAPDAPARHGQFSESWLPKSRGYEIGGLAPGST